MVDEMRDIWAELAARKAEYWAGKNKKEQKEFSVLRCTICLNNKISADIAAKGPFKKVGDKYFHVGCAYERVD